MINEKDKAQFQELGYFVTDVVIEPDQLQFMADEMDRLYREGFEEAKATGDSKAVLAAEGRRSYGQVHNRSQIAAEFVRSEIYLEACRAFIGPNADLYWNQAATKPPQLGKTFSWHQDSGYTETVPLAYITCWTAISDSNLENGGIWVLPRSHKWGVLEHENEEPNQQVYGGLRAKCSDYSGAVPVEMKAGQVAIFSSLTLHMSGPNTSRNSMRRGYVPQYHVPGVILKKTGKPVGDQFPVLRDGLRVS